MRLPRAAMTLAAWLVASLAASVVVARPAAAVETCAASRVDVSSWPIVRSPSVPGLSLRLPRSFEREPDVDRRESASSVASARWRYQSRGQLVISRGASVSAGFPPPAGRPQHARCEERVGSAVATIVSYARGEPTGGAAPAAPFRVHARLRWPDGEEIVVSGDAADPERFGELLAAVRTIRRVGA